MIIKNCVEGDCENGALIARLVSQRKAACEALEKLLAMKTINSDARYFAKVAVSHLVGDAS